MMTGAMTRRGAFLLGPAHSDLCCSIGTRTATSVQLLQLLVLKTVFSHICRAQLLVASSLYTGYKSPARRIFFRPATLSSFFAISTRSLTKHHELAALVRQSRERYRSTIITSEIVATESNETVLNVLVSTDKLLRAHTLGFFFLKLFGSFSLPTLCL